MTEVEWRECNNPKPMLDILVGRTSERKLRLFACACCRRIWHIVEDAAARELLEVTEAFADDLLHEAALQTSITDYHAHGTEAFPHPIRVARSVFGFASEQRSDGRQFRYAAHNAALAVSRTPGFCPQELAGQACLLRCILGNPFRTITLPVVWQIRNVASLARAAYDERRLPSGELDPHRLAILADAVEEAGGSGDLVAHLRSPGPHVRGCFAVDLCLGLS
jgi:hypothetical protein